MGVTDLSKEDGVNKFINTMNEAFKPEDEVKAYDMFVEFFVDMKRKPEEKIKDFIVRFEKLSSVAKNNKMELSQTVLGLKLLHDAGLSATDKTLVMSEINFKNRLTYKGNQRAG